MKLFYRSYPGETESKSWKVLFTQVHRHHTQRYTAVITGHNEESEKQYIMLSRDRMDDDAYDFDKDNYDYLKPLRRTNMDGMESGQIAWNVSEE